MLLYIPDPGFKRLEIFFLNFIRLSYHKITNMPKKNKITIELGNAAQKDRYERETHEKVPPGCFSGTLF